MRDNLQEIDKSLVKLDRLSELNNAFDESQTIISSLDDLFLARIDSIVVMEEEVNTLKAFMSEAPIDDSLSTAYTEFLKSVEKLESKKGDAHTEHLIKRIKQHYESTFKQRQLRAERSNQYADFESELNFHKSSTDSLEIIFNKLKTSIKNKKIKLANVKIPTTPNYYKSIKAHIDRSTTNSNTTAISHFENKQGFLKKPLTNSKSLNRYTEGSQNNSGVDFASKSDNLVKNIFEGVVYKKIIHRDHSISVIIDHGNGYYSSYSNLKYSTLQEGDFKQTGELIGILNSNNKDEYVLRLELWKNSDNLNPAHWLKK